MGCPPWCSMPCRLLLLPVAPTPAHYRSARHTPSYRDLSPFHRATIAYRATLPAAVYPARAMAHTRGRHCTRRTPRTAYTRAHCALVCRRRFPTPTLPATALPPHRFSPPHPAPLGNLWHTFFALLRICLLRTACDNVLSRSLKTPRGMCAAAPYHFVCASMLAAHVAHYGMPARAYSIAYLYIP